MAVDPSDFFDIAEWTLSKGDEMGRRNAASRAYYSAFLTCRNAAQGKLMIPADARSHTAIIESYILSGDPNLRSIGYMLKQCRNIRLRADYDIHLDFSKTEVDQTMSQTKRIIKRIADQLPKTS